jgi:hypothetical protein
MKAKKYYSPTPKIFRVIGDALLMLSTSITTYAILDGNKTWALISLFSGVVGKVLSNYFTTSK